MTIIKGQTSTPHRTQVCFFLCLEVMQNIAVDPVNWAWVIILTTSIFILFSKMYQLGVLSWVHVLLCKVLWIIQTLRKTIREMCHSSTWAFMQINQVCFVKCYQFSCCCMFPKVVLEYLFVFFSFSEQIQNKHFWMRIIAWACVCWTWHLMSWPVYKTTKIQ